MYLEEEWIGRLVTLNYFFVGGWADFAYMNKRFDEAMMKRGFTNTDIRNGQRRWIRLSQIYRMVFEPF